MNQANTSSVTHVGDNQNQESAALPEDGDEALLKMANKTLPELERTLENVDSLPSCSKRSFNDKNNSEISDISDAEEDNPNDRTYIQNENESDSSSNDIILILMKTKSQKLKEEAAKRDDTSMKLNWKA
nr:unnamed protein product [Callosobruchus chinensis]